MSPTPQVAHVDPAALLLRRFVALYQQLDHGQLHRLGEVYHPQISFIDPLHRVEGLPALTHYFDGLYRRLKQCRVQIHDQLVQGDQAALYWTMEFNHPSLNHGDTVRLEGHSHLKFGALIHYHRDYFDAGQMLYEQLPLLGSVIRRVKLRVAP
ncbi:nuclear transport factor 2 family protein [Ferrimonas sediminicola]|uniref:Nuclear transport factor 2 family protein n=1 Tax=Ferrimonas sediminicola TaxID=2569538 RepID=A0A4U1BHP9_9GAMM|nr:nuclear transport factor 2 family protein [Ferrimonas sediminicola]TKB50594.1 nuclear transport factor 2 family protein [Ferrimonas sediminicola]